MMTMTMTIDEALSVVMNDLNTIMIPTSESEKMTMVKNNIREIISAVRVDKEKNQHRKEDCVNGD